MATENTSAPTIGPHRTEIDVPSLAAVLDGEYAGIRELVRTNLVAHAGILDEADALGIDAFRERVREVVVQLAATGQTGMGFPAAYGGGDDVGASIAAFETLAFGDLSVLVKVGVQFGLFGGAILHLGTGHHHKAYLPRLVTGELMGCFAMTESGHGSNVQALGTVARYDPESREFVLTTPDEQARKDYIGNAARHAELAVVFAQLEVDGRSEGVHAFVVPLRADGRVLPGVAIEDDGRKMGLNGVDNGRIRFDGVRVPREALLDRFARVTPEGTYESAIEDPGRRFFTMLGTLVQGRVSVAGAGVSVAKVALAVATKYADRRRQFEASPDTGEQVLLDYGLHQRRLLPLLARTYALHFAQDVVRSQLHEVFSGAENDPQARRRLESRAAGIKALATWHATRVVQECREACGGAGYLAENRFAALKRDSDVFTTFEGDNHVLLQLVAKGLLTDHASEFEDLDQLGMVRYVTGLAVETVIERTSAHKLLERVRDLLPGGDAWDREAGLLDSEYQLAMVRFREEHMLAGLARRIKRGIDRQDAPGAVFSHVQDHVIALARAHVERLITEAFVDKVRALPEGSVKDALGLPCDLFALSAIEADRAWFMEHGRLTVQRSKAISREVNELCRKVRPLAVDLVDAWGIPAAVLRAPDLVGPVG
ncbi:acyl-CoA oxidase [Streptomyces sp. SID4946]|uniref:acyl-CoA dehydrogenase family protein n=1 Tax=Streptomyces sp. LamerLS-31b TaxID=1839765 RepID=UPI00081F44DD|nr:MULTISPECIES: acyl-CoA dehydrogenase [unclassified Streptomyces]MYQ94824.1 acyl-CoA oxidase [Streptomyces sp. SID4946]SCF91639.1 Acyl-coenzyme A oxidase [Streptomyces sp. DconLS]SCF92215.1 Acyl-coenzyme A oxidase [Streptomyces sp. LamerLS-31b]